MASGKIVTYRDSFDPPLVNLHQTVTSLEVNVKGRANCRTVSPLVPVQHPSLLGFRYRSPKFSECGIVFPIYLSPPHTLEEKKSDNHPPGLASVAESRLTKEDLVEHNFHEQQDTYIEIDIETTRAISPAMQREGDGLQGGTARRIRLH
ncbi:hypothetical protein DPMN_124826 [Dreissena polymorpha]|uniref:Uncharacterized protein n=1 Tax=Dreissena polymorpha TaxID=45954 RepID=A0A9D4GX19_DREPO|nr:hypothetical protein DPMN_124826 [Dreissena polymorpha]